MNRNQNSHNNPTFLIAAGGTGGHVFPALAIAEAIKKQQPEAGIVFAGTRNRIESRVVPQAGFGIEYIWISGFHRRLTWKNVLFPIKLLVSLVQSYLLLRRNTPDIVVCCGGYVTGPVGWVAALLRIPLVLQEQNSYPGVTNRILGSRATRIYTAFEEATHYFPSDRVLRTGNPTRNDLEIDNREEAYEKFEFSPDKRTLLIMGGSGGARSINQAMAKNLDTLHQTFELQIIWICGKRYERKIRESIDIQNYSNLRLYDFLDDIAAAYEVADLVISRAGAGSCAELQQTGNASILVPSPNVAGDHQRKNAHAMARNGAAHIIEDGLLSERLTSDVREILSDKSKLNEMKRAARALARPEAANQIANDIFNIINEPKVHE